MRIPVSTCRCVSSRDHVVDDPAKLLLGRLPERVGQVVRADEDHAEALHGEDLVEVLDGRGRLDLHCDQRLGERLGDRRGAVEAVQRCAPRAGAAGAARG